MKELMDTINTAAKKTLSNTKEVDVSIGNKIKNASPFKHIFIFTHCNGGEGYLSPKESYKERGYEVLYDPYGPKAEDIGTKSILEELYKQYED